MGATIEELLTGFPVRIEQAVVWGELDAFRHVNNVVYFRYFENVRIEYFRQLGMTMNPEGRSIGTILASVEARFRKPLFYPDSVVIGARVLDIAHDRLTMEHHVISRQQQAVTTEGVGVIVTYDYTEKRKVPLPDDLRQAIKALETSSPI